MHLIFLVFFMFCFQLACSAGSACHSVPTTSNTSTAAGSGVELKSKGSMNSSATVSSVLRAMRVSPTHAAGTLRLSFGRHTTERDIELAVAHIHAEVTKRWTATYERVSSHS